MAEQQKPTGLDELISAGLDGELDIPNQNRLSARLAEDPDATALANAMQDVDQALRNSFKSILDAPLPLSLVRNISKIEADSENEKPQYRPGMRYLAEQTKPKRGSSGFLRAAAILLMIGAGVAAGYATSHRFPSEVVANLMGVTTPPGWIEQVAQYHAFYARETRHLVEVPAQEQTHIETWIGERVSVPFKVPDLSSQDLTFQGARLLLINGAPIAQLLYLPSDGRAVGICFKPTTNPDSPPVQSNFGGTSILSWNHDGVAFVIAGFAGEAPLEPLMPLAENAI